MTKKIIGVLLTAAFLHGCTSIQVKPLDKTAGMQHVCIEENPQVIIKDFVPVVQEGFQRHGITTEIYSGNVPAACQYTLTYTALRSWDFAPYLSYAELDLFKNGSPIASADYHLRGKGGFSLMKWQGVKKKMDPVIDQLLKDY